MPRGAISKETRKNRQKGEFQRKRLRRQRQERGLAHLRAGKHGSIYAFFGTVCLRIRCAPYVEGGDRRLVVALAHGKLRVGREIDKDGRVFSPIAGCFGQFEVKFLGIVVEDEMSLRRRAREKVEVS